MGGWRGLGAYGRSDGGDMVPGVAWVLMTTGSFGYAQDDLFKAARSFGCAQADRQRRILKQRDNLEQYARLAAPRAETG